MEKEKKEETLDGDARKDSRKNKTAEGAAIQTSKIYSVFPRKEGGASEGVGVGSVEDIRSCRQRDTGHTKGSGVSPSRAGLLGPGFKPGIIFFKFGTEMRIGCTGKRENRER